MMQKRTLTSLLLTSFLVAFAFSYSMANEVTFGSPNVLRCDNNVLAVTVDNTVEVAAIEIVFEISGNGGAYFDAFSVNWDAGFTELGTRIIDLSQADGVDPDTVRLAALLIDSLDVSLPAGSHVVANVSFTTNNSCGGNVVLDGAIFDYPLVPSTIETQFVDANTFDVLPVAVNAGTVTFQNDAPSIAAIADATLPWGSLFQTTAVGSDDDLANGCEVLTYSKVSGPAALSVNASSGQISWATTGADVCVHTVEIQVEDSCGATATTSFEICVTNEAPVASSVDQDEPQWVLGDNVMGGVSANDPDGGPNNLAYSVLSFDGPGTVNINANTGAWDWQTVAFDDAYVGEFELCVVVSDNANTCDPCSPNNADTVCATIFVKQALLVIDKNHGIDTDDDGLGNGVLQGQKATLDIYLNANIDIGGFDLLVNYDPTALSFVSAELGDAPNAAGWEYFQYRTTPFGNCEVGCPEGFLRFVGIADQNDGPNHPTDTIMTGVADSVLVSMEFFVSNDRTLECQFVPVTFAWYDCGDNTLSSIGGDTLFISNSVWNYAGGVGAIPGDPGDSYIEVPMGSGFPTGGGHPVSCETSDKAEPWRVIDFWNGGIDIICGGDIDGRGDLNLDGIGYTIADAVMYTNYFIYGLGALPEDNGNNARAASIAASDVNADGLTLTVADLVYLIRVVVGDAVAYPDSPLPKLEPVSAKMVTVNGNLNVENTEIAAAFVEVKGNVVPRLLANNMAMDYNFDGVNTKIIVFPPFENESSLNTFSGEFLNVGNAPILATEIVTPAGALVNVDVLPSNYALAQNYPNPFNPSTTIEFSLPVASDYTLTVYNVTGQRVAEFSGSQEVGVVQVVWEAGQNASGVYFYKLVTDSFSETKKAVLLK